MHQSQIWVGSIPLKGIIESLDIYYSLDYGKLGISLESNILCISAVLSDSLEYIIVMTEMTSVYHASIS